MPRQLKHALARPGTRKPAAAGPEQLQAYHNRAVSAAAIRWHSRVVRAITISSSSADPKFPEPTQGQDPMIGPGTVAILQLGTKCAYEQYRQHYK
eukprot:1009544-Rhodomonas_salina.2